MKKNDEPVVVEETYRQSPANVWKAITEIDRMKEWYFQNIPDFRAEIGFKTEFVVDTGERSFRHLWEVIEVVPERKLVYNWKYGEHPGDSFVTFEISGEGEATKMKLTHRVREDFPDDIPEFTRESGLGGWRYFINERLKAYLEK